MFNMGLQWLTLVCTIWLQSINGSNSNFPAYSSLLKRLLSLSQLQLNNLASVSDAGKLLGWVSGLASMYLPLWLTLKCYIVTIHNFPYDRQVAVGLSTSYMGLSAKIYTGIVETLAFYPSDKARTYLMLNSILPLMVSLLVSPIVRETKSQKTRYIGGGFVILFAITIVTGTFSVTSSLNLIKNKLSPLVVAILMGILLLLPLVVPMGEWATETVNKSCSIRREDKVYSFRSIDENVAEKGIMENGEGKLNIYEVRVKEEIGVGEMVRRVELWLYLFVYFFGATLGMVYLNNLGQIAESRGYTSTLALVSISSAFGFFGRLLPSLMDYFFSRTKFIISRPASIAMMTAPISASFFLLLSSTTLSLYISTAIIGLCTGAIISISVSLTTELFGTKNFSVNHNIVVANIPIGSFLFGDVAALFYHKHIGERNGMCLGMQCYQTTFIIWGCLCSLGTFLAIVLHMRTRKFYSHRF